MSIAAGDRFGVYEVLSPIGAGGMGKVYRARDTRLNREVAVKVLSPQFDLDPDRRARFEREAQALAALNHQNIAHVYGIVDVSGHVGATSIPALVMELVPGEDLAQRILRGPIAVDEAVRIALQIADGLDAAHERGIVHRDLKPANVRLSAQGSVKILDFGLAKTLGAPDGLDVVETVSSPVVTEDGTILGTVPYMSPEQLRGQPVDRRTDIWAFGCVLYEMLSGQRAFRGRTPSDVTAAILTADPDWSALPKGTPSGVRRVLSRVLQKDLKRRARDIADVRFELEEAPGPAPAVATARPASLFRPGPIIALLSTAVASAVLTWLALQRPVTNERPPTTGGRAIVTQLTGKAGFASYGAMAPDGGSFAYVAISGGQTDIFRRQIEGGVPVQLTSDAAIESDLVFAPGGDAIYFTREDAGRVGIWRIGALGGNPRKIVDDARAPAVSRDGRQLAWLASSPSGAYSVIVAGADGASPRTVARDLRFQEPRAPSWSPDGRQLAYSPGQLFQPRNLYIANVADGAVRQVTRYENGNEGPTTQSWLPDGRLLVTYWAQSRAQLVNDLGLLDVETGEIERLTMNTAEGFTAQSVSLDGSRVLVTVGYNDREVWRVPDGPDPAANGRQAEMLVGRAEDPMWTYGSRDGRTLLYNNALVGSRNLWMMPFDRSHPARQVTSVPGDRVMHSSLSPEGSRIAFISTANGHADVWTQNIDGSGLRPLTNDAAADAWPVWSPDGRSVMYTANNRTFIVPVDGGDPRHVIDGFFRGDWIARPDGKGTWAVTVIPNAGIRLIDVENRTELWRVQDQVSGLSMPMFNRDGSAISFALRDGPDRFGIDVIDTATRTRRRAARFSEPFLFNFRASWIDNDRAFAVNRFWPRSHLVLFDEFLPKR